MLYRNGLIRDPVDPFALSSRTTNGRRDFILALHFRIGTIGPGGDPSHELGMTNSSTGFRMTEKARETNFVTPDKRKRDPGSMVPPGPWMHGNVVR